MLTLVQRLGDLRAFIAEAAHLLPRQQARLQPTAILGNRLRRTGEHIPIPHPTTRLENAGFRQIPRADEHARRETVEIAPAIGFESEYAAGGQARAAEFEFITEFEIQRAQHPIFHPGIPRRWAGFDRVRGRIQFIGDFQTTLERITVIHRLDPHQQNLVIGADHAGKLHRPRPPEAKLLGLSQSLGVRRTTADQRQIAADDIVRVGRHGGADARGEMGNGGVAGNGDHQRQQQ